MQSDKGLAYYDKNDQLETILKNVINFNKDFLSLISNIVNGLPILGPILGPRASIHLMFDYPLMFSQSYMRSNASLMTSSTSLKTLPMRSWMPSLRS